MSDALPCPFCGGRASMSSDLRGGYEQHADDPDARAYYYVCDSCAAIGGWAKSATSALRLWNMRTQSTRRQSATKEHQ